MKITPNGLRIKKKLQVNWSMISDEHRNKLETRWRRIVRSCEQSLNKIMRDFYSYADTQMKGDIDKTEYTLRLRQKCNKLSKLMEKRVDPATLGNIHVKKTEDFGKDISNSQLETLSLGMKFIPTSREFNRLELIQSLQNTTIQITLSLPHISRMGFKKSLKKRTRKLENSVQKRAKEVEKIGKDAIAPAVVAAVTTL
ncbi:hypothetical protein GJ496_000348 [Pomphorhynchus laevis]|nr:hypothetical protein GJ496_000348 [Pomphorhynchus laevis]